MDLPNAPKAGDVIAGRYQVERTLGSGGMGVVVAAVDRKVGRTVAVKLLLQHLAGSVRVDRFFREARAVSSIRSDHVARVIEFGSLDNLQPYMVMECLTGRDLGERLRADKSLPLPDVADCVLQVCEALAHAHGAGIVHRDIKPSNLFEHDIGRGAPIIKVLDFGISKSLARNGAEHTLTSSRDGLLGSPPYMSPEQVRDARRVDHRTDLWSLGVVVYRLLSNRLPFEGHSLGETFAAVLERPLVPLRQLGVAVPEEVDAIIARCLTRDPAGRFANAAELARAFAPFATPTIRPIADRVEEIVAQNPPMRLASSPSLPSRWDDGEPHTITIEPAAGTASIEQLPPPFELPPPDPLFADSLSAHVSRVIFTDTTPPPPVRPRERGRALIAVAVGFAAAFAVTAIGLGHSALSAAQATEITPATAAPVAAPEVVGTQAAVAPDQAIAPVAPGPAAAPITTAQIAQPQQGQAIAPRAEDSKRAAVRPGAPRPPTPARSGARTTAPRPELQPNPYGEP